MKSLTMTVSAMIVGGLSLYVFHVTKDPDSLWFLLVLWPICYFAWKTETNQVEEAVEDHK